SSYRDQPLARPGPKRSATRLVWARLHGRCRLRWLYPGPEREDLFLEWTLGGSARRVCASSKDEPEDAGCLGATRVLRFELPDREQSEALNSDVSQAIWPVRAVVHGQGLHSPEHEQRHAGPGGHRNRVRGGCCVRRPFSGEGLGPEIQELAGPKRHNPAESQ